MPPKYLWNFFLKTILGCYRTLFLCLLTYILASSGGTAGKYKLSKTPSWNNWCAWKLLPPYQYCYYKSIGNSCTCAFARSYVIIMQHDHVHVNARSVCSTKESQKSLVDSLPWLVMNQLSCNKYITITVTLLWLKRTHCYPFCTSRV